MSVRSDWFLPCVTSHSGVHFSDDGKNGLVLDFGNPAEEIEAVGRGAFLCDAPGAGEAVVTGEAGLKLLRRLLTADAACFPPGSAFRAAMLNASGGIMLESLVIAGNDTWELVFPPGAADAGKAWTRQVAVAFDAEVAEPAGRHAFWMGGPRLAETLRGIGIEMPAPGKTVCVGDGADTVVIAALPDMVLAVGAVAAANRLWEKVEAAGAVPVGEQGWELARTLACMPALRRDYDESSSPVEFGFEACVDFRDAGRMFIGRALTEARSRSGVRCRMGVLEIDAEVDPREFDEAPEAVVESSASEGVLVTTWARGHGKSYALALLPVSARTGDRAVVQIAASGKLQESAGRVLRLA